MALQFRQDEIEGEFSDILKHSDLKDISRITGIHYSVIAGMFNRNDERKSALYVALQIICAMDEICPERGEEAVKAFLGFRELSKKRTGANTSSLEIEAGKLNREISEFISAKLEGKPLEVQFKELVDAESQLAQVKNSLINERNKLNENARPATLTAVK